MIGEIDNRIFSNEVVIDDGDSLVSFSIFKGAVFSENRRHVVLRDVILIVHELGTHLLDSFPALLSL